MFNDIWLVCMVFVLLLRVVLVSVVVWLMIELLLLIRCVFVLIVIFCVVCSELLLLLIDWFDICRFVLDVIVL